jgi:hypothetical protein
MEFPKQKISASLINSYFSCPFGFKLTVIDGYLTKEGPALEQGSMFDYMFKIYHNGKDPYEETKKKFFNEIPTAQQLDNFIVARKMMLKYEKNPKKFKEPKFDIGFGIDISEIVKRPIKLTGYLDGMDGTEGIEVKTASSLKDWNQERVDTEIQSKIYRYYIHKTFNVEKPVLHYIVFPKNKDDYIELKSETKDGDFDELFKKVNLFIESVEAEKFDKNPNHPFYCPCRQLSKELGL